MIWARNVRFQNHILLNSLSFLLTTIILINIMTFTQIFEVNRIINADEREKRTEK